ncbi:hypothetical protein BD626DRAFT_493702 [Schizophyllum amplum]|uniref:Uncharacterized protein n=1 Tax=Schizophyllum amplum TaxID=97359 RepID=A0A550CH20_9AGAR|nr:hypothetical protein BD626DRAFT_493702 [Auriculariopsis ampla]
MSQNSMLVSDLAQKDADSDRGLPWSGAPGRAPILLSPVVSAANTKSIFRLPSEILSELFLHALPDHWPSALAGRRPLYLAQVCRHWREVARQTPQIWSAITINDEQNPPAMYEAEIMEELARTGATPLAVFIDMANDGDHLGYPSRWPPGSVWKGSERVWDALCAQSHRWSACGLYFLPPSAFAPNHRVTFPHLRHIGLAMNPPDPEVACSLPLHFFADALHVDSLQLHYCRKPPSRLVLPPTWALAALSITFNDVIFDQVFPLHPCMPVIMSSSRTLRSLRLSNQFYGRFPPLNEHVLFPALEYLYLDDAGIQICRLIVAPNLKGVRLSGRTVTSEDLGNEITAFEILLDRSSGCPSLQHLEIRVLRAVSLSRLFILLERLPSLQYLRLFGGYLPENEHHASPMALRMLTRTTDPESCRFLPNLIRLHIEIGQNTALLTDEYLVLLRDMLASRARPASAMGKASAAATSHAITAIPLSAGTTSSSDAMNTDTAPATLRDFVSDKLELLKDLPPGLQGYLQPVEYDSYGEVYRY